MSIVFIFAIISVVYIAIGVIAYKQLMKSKLQTPIPKNASSGTLAKIVDTVLAFLLGVNFVGLLVWPLVVLAIGLSHLDQASWGVDIRVFSKFVVDFNALALQDIQGLRDPVVKGVTHFGIDTHSRTAWFTLGLLNQIGMLFGFMGIILIKKVVRSIRVGDPFKEPNTLRIKKIGYLIIGWNLVMPIAHFFLANIALNKVDFNHDAVDLSPAFMLDVTWLLVGFLVVVMSKLMQEAEAISKESELTI